MHWELHSSDDTMYFMILQIWVSLCYLVSGNNSILVFSEDQQDFLIELSLKQLRD